jgi:hypothetical protein
VGMRRRLPGRKPSPHHMPTDDLKGGRSLMVGGLVIRVGMAPETLRKGAMPTEALRRGHAAPVTGPQAFTTPHAHGHTFGHAVSRLWVGW